MLTCFGEIKVELHSKSCPGSAYPGYFQPQRQIGTNGGVTVQYTR